MRPTSSYASATRKTTELMSCYSSWSKSAQRRQLSKRMFTSEAHAMLLPSQTMTIEMHNRRCYVL